MQRLIARLFLALLLPAGVVAQRAIAPIRGTVVDSAGRPIENVEITASSVGRLVRSDSSGRFAIDTLLIGRNRLLARRLGWKAIDTTIILDAKRAVEVRFVMGRVAQSLGEVRIVSHDDCPIRTLEGFECRRRAGIGAFRDSAEIAALKPVCPAGVVYGMAGLRQVPHLVCPGYEATTGWRCLVTLVDGLPRGGGPLALMKDYVGVEFYARYDDAPAWYKQYAFEGSTKGVPTHQDVRGGDLIYRKASLPGRNCSLLIYWSHFATRYDPKLDQSKATSVAMKSRRDSLIAVADSMLKRKP